MACPHDWVQGPQALLRPERGLPLPDYRTIVPAGNVPNTWVMGWGLVEQVSVLKSVSDCQWHYDSLDSRHSHLSTGRQYKKLISN